MTRLFLLSSALTAALMACSGATATKASSDRTAGSNDQVPSENCCCKFLKPSAAAPSFEPGNRMECSAKQGECVEDQLCPQEMTPDGVPAPPP